MSTSSSDFHGYENDGLKIYHGLQKKFRFSNFFTYFNQPISTTQVFKEATEFSAEKGIILALESCKEDNKIPKCLSVGFLSDHKHEEEILFYSQYNQLKIYDIIERDALKVKHRQEVTLFNKVQSILQNERVTWDYWDTEKTEINILCTLIKYQLNKNADDLNDYQSSGVSEYGLKLFDFFCKHEDRAEIAIQDFRSLPKELLDVLFARDGKTSLLSIASLFPCMENLYLNHISHLKKAADECIEAALELANSDKQIKLQKIEFQSSKAKKCKPSQQLKGIPQKYRSKLNKLWKIEYNWRYQTQTHKILVFNQNYEKQQEQIDSRETPQKVIERVESICNTQDDLSRFRPEFVSYFKKKCADGESFLPFDSNQQHIFINAFKDKKRRNSAQILVGEYVHIANVASMKHYKPSPIDIKTQKAVFDHDEKQVYVFWNSPSDSLGKTTYRIIQDSEQKTNVPERVIDVLPFTISYDILPATFKVTTIVTVKHGYGEDEYESEPSELIKIKKAVMRKISGAGNKKKKKLAHDEAWITHKRSNLRRSPKRKSITEIGSMGIVSQLILDNDNSPDHEQNDEIDTIISPLAK